VTFNVGEIATTGRFNGLGGHFVIYQIWGAISVSMRAISAGCSVLKFWTDSKNKNHLCHLGTNYL